MKNLIETEFILTESKKLATHFRNSTLYHKYCDYKNQLESDSALLAQVKAYKQNQIELETKRLANGNVDFNEEKQVSQQYTDLTLHPIAGEFLHCEYELLQLFATVFDIINDSCEEI
ncbi:MAG: YlbF family regulator [Firmicutes bacterium]|nr:YlbF family regulator [Bacillota bacterium]